MTLYIGVDFHPHQQTVSYCNTEHGEVEQISLAHNVELVRRFYEQFPKAVVGIEASCTAARVRAFDERTRSRTTGWQSDFDQSQSEISSQVGQARCRPDSGAALKRRVSKPVEALDEKPIGSGTTSVPASIG